MKSAVFSIFLIGLMINTVLASDPGLVSEAKINIAVISLKAGNGVAQGESELITDRLRVELFRTGSVNVMERDQMQEILKEQGFQQSGACSDEACMVEMGQLLGVQFLVAGSLGRLGELFMLNLRMVDVKTGKISNVVSRDVRGSIEDVVGNLPEAAEDLVNGESEEEEKGEPEVGRPQMKSAGEQEVSSRPVVNKRPVKIRKRAAAIRKKKAIAARNKNRSGLSFRFEKFNSGIGLDGSVDSLFLDGVFGSDTLDMRSVSSQVPYTGYHLRYISRVGSRFSASVGPGVRVGETTFLDTVSRINKELDLRYVEFLIYTDFCYSHRFWTSWKFNLGLALDLNIPVVMYEYTRSVRDYGLLDSGLKGQDAWAQFNAVFSYRIGLEKVWKHWGLSLDFLYRTLEQQMDFDFDEADEEPDVRDPQLILFPSSAVVLGVNYYF